MSKTRRGGGRSRSAAPSFASTTRSSTARDNLSPASAFRDGGTTVIIPIIGRFPGAGGTQWRTDVFISAHGSLGNSPTLTFYLAGGSPMSTTVTLAPFSSVALGDIVLNTFGQSNASGQLEIKSSNDAETEARARIYNAGNAAGEFGQNVPGIGSDLLSRQAFLFGLSGVNGNRVNVGVANPTNAVVTSGLRIADKNNVTLYSASVMLRPHETQQFNDIFAGFFVTPQADVMVEFNTLGTPVYGYASEVRNDTGDAIFIFGTSPNALH